MSNPLMSRLALRVTALRGIACLVLAAASAACQPASAPASSGSAVDGLSGGDIVIAGRNSDFLVKLTTSMSAERNEPGDPVAGVIILPEPLRGGRVSGSLERADRTFLDFAFDTVTYDGQEIAIRSVVTAVVSSKGNLGQDDLGQRIRIVGGGIVAYGTTTAIDEGAEIRFVAWQD